MTDYIDSLYVALRQWRFWFYYSLQDIKNKYTRSFIGPLWITITMSLMVFAMGPLYGSLFNQSTEGYFLYLATGLVYWSFISTTIIESCDVYLGNATFIRQSDFPLFVYIFRLLSRNLIMFLHNITIPFIIALLTGSLTISALKIFIWVPLTLVFLFPVVCICSVLCARFRDFTPMFQNAVQLAMFLTPVFWMVGDNRHSSLYVKYNPLFYILDGFRFCFDVPGSTQNFFVISLVFLVLLPISIYFYVKSYKKIVYWI